MENHLQGNHGNLNNLICHKDNTGGKHPGNPLADRYRQWQALFTASWPRKSGSMLAGTFAPRKGQTTDEMRTADIPAMAWQREMKDKLEAC